MAKRPVFVATGDPARPVRTEEMEFRWFPGMALSQSRLSINSLHQAYEARFPGSRLLEISSRSAEELGWRLSAFNLDLEPARLVSEGPRERISVESAFQGSKVFADGGPFRDLCFKSAREAKTDPRLAGPRILTAFDFFGQTWPTRPLTLFYDWLYLRALDQHPDLGRALTEHDAFTDIAFNPARSINCQARAAALFVTLTRSGTLEEALASPKAFTTMVRQMPNAENAASRRLKDERNKPQPELFG